MAHPVQLRYLGRSDYQTVFEQMRSYTQDRDANSADEVWITEHNPVFTQGQAGKAEHLLAPGNIPVVQTDRGGQVTYHGPGQIVGYLLFDLKRMGLGVKALVSGIESAMIEALAEFGIAAARRPDAPGVYVGNDKIGALGLRVKRGCSYHGLSLNVAMDLAPFARINPCGLTDIGVTQIADLVPPAQGANADLTELACQRLLAALSNSYALVFSPAADGQKKGGPKSAKTQTIV